MDAEWRIPLLNQIKNTNIFSSLKTKALQVGVAPVDSNDGGKQHQTVQKFGYDKLDKCRCY